MLRAIAFGLFIGLAAGAPAAEVAAADARVAQLLAAMGGRDAWAATTALRVDATHYEAQFARPYENRIWMSFTVPRMRFEAASAEIRRTRAVSGETGWRISEKSPLGPMTPDQVKGDLDWWEAHIYRTVHRLARGDPTLTARVADDGRLTIHRADGSQLMWIRQNIAGEPLQFGVGTRTEGTIFGPLLETRGIRIPRFSVSPDGSWRALIRGIEANPDLAKVDFSRP